MKIKYLHKIQNSLEKITLINRLYELGYFVLNNGAIENYYPSGYIGADKPSKALNALEMIKNSNIQYLPKITYESRESCELTRMMDKIFSEPSHSIYIPSEKEVSFELIDA